jgi:glycosyltransferase involved in cell wall biosynthesis
MPTVELSMIVKDGESTLARCLESARSVVDEIVIADTGSTDATVQIARSYQARVVDVPWEDDFSKARNAALRHGRCDWVLFLDADELLDLADAKGIAALVADPAVLGYDVRIWNYVSTLSTRMLNRPAQRNPHRIAASRSFPGYVEHVNVRLFRRHPEIFFEGRVHEGVADCMKRKGLKVAPASFVIHHLGIAEDPAEQRNRKMEYYQELGRKKLEEAPDDALANYELGLGELEHFHNPGGALKYFMRAIELKRDSDVLFTYAGMCLVRLGEAEKGLEVLQRAERLGARDAVHLEAMGDAQYHMERFGEARRSYEAALTAGSESIILKGKLGVCEVRLGSTEAGLHRIQHAIEHEPQFGELYDILMAAALFAGNRPLAAETAERRLRVGTPSADSFLLTAGIWVQLGEWQKAAGVAQSGCQRFPADARLCSALAEVNQKLGI